MKIVSAWLISLFTGMYTSAPELEGMIDFDDTNTEITETAPKNTEYDTFVLGGLGDTEAESNLCQGGFYHIPYDWEIKTNIAILPGSLPPIASLGQSVCLWITEKFFARKKPTQNSLAIGYSMGGGRLINALARNKNNLTGNLGMIILDSCLISGNHAIKKTCQLLLNQNSILSKLTPYLSSFLPYALCSYVAKAIFPFYSPGGLQPHNSLEEFKDFDKNAKIVFIHSEGDIQVDYWGAVYAYFRLKEMGFTNLFFIDDTLHSFVHVNLSNLQHNTKEFLSALQKNNNSDSLLAEDSENKMLYQPDWDHFAKKHHYLNSRKSCQYSETELCQYSERELKNHYKNHTGPFNFVRYDRYLRYLNNYVINPTIAIGTCYGAKKIFNYCKKRIFGN